MNTADFNELSEGEKPHFYQCSRCGEMVDMRQLDDVLFHEDHVQRLDIQYGGLVMSYGGALKPQSEPAPKGG
jgi:hypothetical protein